MRPGLRARRSLVVLVLAASACGKKGPPLAPLIIAPARIEDLTARRSGDDVFLTFTIPRQNQDGKSPADLERVELYALTGDTTGPGGRPLEARRLLRLAAKVAQVEVEPPPREPKEGAPPAESKPEDPRPAQGEVVTLKETLTVRERTPVAAADSGRGRRQTPADSDVDLPAPLAWPPPYHPTSRLYVAVGVSTKGRRGALSARVSVPLDALPPSGPVPVVTYTEAGTHLEWPLPDGLRLSFQAPPLPEQLRIRPLFAGPPMQVFNVYAWNEADPLPALPAPLNPQPLGTPAFDTAAPQFGVSRCYGVRVVEVVGQATIEGPLSPPRCITAVDTFPPAAPRALAAVGSEGLVSLIWEANTEADLAGYLVLRGEAGGQPTTLLTPTPIKETNYPDTTAVPGVRYVYAVVAVDTAPAANRSALSNLVEEAAR